MTDKLIATDGTSSGLSTGAAISDTDYLEMQQSVTAPAGTVNNQFSAVKTWVKGWIAKADVGLGNVANSLQLVAASNLSDVASALTSRANLGVSAFFKSYVSGRFYVFPFTQGGASAATTSANKIYLFPVVVPRSVTVSQLFARVGTGSSGNFQAAIYAADATTLMPTGTALSSTASGSTTTGNTTVAAALGANVTMNEGSLYWIGINVDNGTATFATLSVALGTASWLIGDTTVGNVIFSGAGATIHTGYNVAQTFGTWPDLTSGSFTANAGATFPMVGFKVA